MRLELLDKHISFDDKLVAEELDKLDAAFSENAEKILLENIKRFAETNWLYENITNSI